MFYGEGGHDGAHIYIHHPFHAIVILIIVFAPSPLSSGTRWNRDYLPFVMVINDRMDVAVTSASKKSNDDEDMTITRGGDKDDNPEKRMRMMTMMTKTTNNKK